MAKDSEQATYVPTKEDAFTLLWLLTMGNMAIGFVFWVWNTVALEFVGLDYASEELEAILWREIGSGFFSFGLGLFRSSGMHSKQWVRRRHADLTRKSAPHLLHVLFRYACRSTLI